MTPNPYVWLRLSELARHCWRLGDELLTQRRRTAEERAALAQDCGHLLFAVARRIEPKDATPCEPEHAANRPHQFAKAFGDWAESELRSARFHVLQRAAEYVLGDQAVHWRPEGYSPTQPAHQTDAGLRDALAGLPVAEPLAVGRKLDRRHRRLLESLADRG
ncbi:MAG TPA: hypothetical protein VEC14_02655, partial [Reyranellaceae bacterium]|nr:hypothetical protein [Reyranellaceae bacterium]